jgi:purine-cytosine permease-like protein
LFEDRFAVADPKRVLITRFVTISLPFSPSIGDVAIRRIGISLIDFYLVRRFLYHLKDQEIIIGNVCLGKTLPLSRDILD